MKQCVCVFLSVLLILLAFYFPCNADKVDNHLVLIKTFFANDQHASGAYACWNDYLFYLDYTSFSATLLCSRLDCLHQNESNLEDCDGYTGSLSIGLAEDRLYYRHGVFDNGRFFDAVMSKSLDGTGTRRFVDMENTEDCLSFDFGFFGGYYFYGVQRLITQDTADSSTSHGKMPGTNDVSAVNELFYVNLRNPLKKPAMIDSWDEAETLLFLYQVMDDKLYYAMVAGGDQIIWVYD